MLNAFLHGLVCHPPGSATFGELDRNDREQVAIALLTRLGLDLSDSLLAIQEKRRTLSSGEFEITDKSA